MIFFSFNNILESCIIIFVGVTVFYYGDLLSFIFFNYCLYQFSHSIASFSLWPHGLQHARLPCPSLFLPEFAQTHVRWVSDTIQPSHPLSSCSPPAFDLSQNQGLFLWVSSLHQAVKVSYNWIQIWHYVEVVWTPNSSTRLLLLQMPTASLGHLYFWPISYKVRRAVGFPTIPLFRFENLLEWYF